MFRDIDQAQALFGIEPGDNLISISLHEEMMDRKKFTSFECENCIRLFKSSERTGKTLRQKHKIPELL